MQRRRARQVRMRVRRAAACWRRRACANGCCSSSCRSSTSTLRSPECARGALLRVGFFAAWRRAPIVLTGGAWECGVAVAQHQISYFRFQISDFRSRHPAGRHRFPREISDFRFQIPTTHKGRSIEVKQNSKHAEHISRLYDRFLRRPYFRFHAFC